MVNIIKISAVFYRVGVYFENNQAEVVVYKHSHDDLTVLCWGANL